MKDLTGQFTAVGQSESIGLLGDYALSLSGFGTATVALERSLDDGTTWHFVESYTANTEKTIKARGHRIKYRLNCTSFTSGPISYQIRG